MTLLSGKAVGAPFVGATAATLALKQAHTKDEMREDLEAQVLTKSAGSPEGSLSIFGSD